MSCGRYIVSEGVRTPFPLPAASVRSVTFSFRSGFTCCLAGEMIFWLCRRVLNKNEPTRAREGTGGCQEERASTLRASENFVASCRECSCPLQSLLSLVEGGMYRTGLVLFAAARIVETRKKRLNV